MYTNTAESTMRNTHTHHTISVELYIHMGLAGISHTEHKQWCIISTTDRWDWWYNGGSDHKSIIVQPAPPLSTITPSLPFYYAHYHATGHYRLFPAIVHCIHILPGVTLMLLQVCCYDKRIQHNEPI